MWSQSGFVFSFFSVQSACRANGLFRWKTINYWPTFASIDAQRPNEWIKRIKRDGERDRCQTKKDNLQMSSETKSNCLMDNGKQIYLLLNSFDVEFRTIFSIGKKKSIWFNKNNDVGYEHFSDSAVVIIISKQKQTMNATIPLDRAIRWASFKFYSWFQTKAKGINGPTESWSGREDMRSNFELKKDEIKNIFVFFIFKINNKYILMRLSVHGFLTKKRFNINKYLYRFSYRFFLSNLKFT